MNAHYSFPITLMYEYVHNICVLNLNDISAMNLIVEVLIISDYEHMRCINYLNDGEIVNISINLHY